MLKSSVCIAVLISAVSMSTAFAQDASQWAGFYAGASYSTGSADQDYGGGNTFDLEGNGPGLLLGYNYATGPWVVGAELAYSKVEIGQTDGDPFNFESFLDLKARAGYAMDNVLLFGTLGGTFTRWNEGGDSFDGDGLLYGIGVDYLVSAQFIVGAEYTVRDVTSDWNNSGSTFDADVGILSLRAAYRF